MQHYDIIGDIHGHANELIKLLEYLEYTDSETGYRHKTRKVIFLGDFIDRGEHLGQHRKLLDIVMTMVANEHALAVMGNHEFNALAYHTLHEGKYLRRHSEKNTHQHQAFLNEFNVESELKESVLEFFYSLPLWLDLEGIRVVHACWDDQHIDVMNNLTSNQKINHQLLVEASRKGSAAYQAIETLVKGVEVDLPPGVTFDDKDGHTRSAVRVQWWNTQALRLGDIVLPFDLNIGDAADEAIPNTVPIYAPENPPCFIGHYWLDGTPIPLAPNIACVDYSIAKNGKLVAYRWSGEQVLTADNFVYA